MVLRSDAQIPITDSVIINANQGKIMKFGAGHVQMNEFGMFRSWAISEINLVFYISFVNHWLVPSGKSKLIPFSLASQIPRSQMSLVIKRAGVTSNP